MILASCVFNYMIVREVISINTLDVPITSLREQGKEGRMYSYIAEEVLVEALQL